MDFGVKRPSDALVEVSAKRSRHDDQLQLINHYSNDDNRQLMETDTDEPPRTSNLLAPIMLLTGHQGEIFSCKFHPDGESLASTGFDRQIFFWNTYGECENYTIFTGHTGVVLELQYSPEGDRVYTCSSDKSIQVWDLKAGGRIKKLNGHTSVVNSCDVSRSQATFLCSGSDDKTVRLWDLRARRQVHSFKDNYQVLTVAFNEKADQIFVSGIENSIKVYDLRKKSILYTLDEHSDSVTGLSLSPDGSHLLSNSMDNTLQVWDVRPYAPPNRNVATFHGHVHNFEKNLLRCAWSPGGDYITGGSSDRFVYVWNFKTGSIEYKLPGHLGSVNQVEFHPREPIVLSASSDKQLYLGELDLY